MKTVVALTTFAHNASQAQTGAKFSVSEKEAKELIDAGLAADSDETETEGSVSEKEAKEKAQTKELKEKGLQAK